MPVRNTKSHVAPHFACDTALTVELALHQPVLAELPTVRQGGQHERDHHAISFHVDVEARTPQGRTQSPSMRSLTVQESGRETAHSSPRECSSSSGTLTGTRRCRAWLGSAARATRPATAATTTVATRSPRSMPETKPRRAAPASLPGLTRDVGGNGQRTTKGPQDELVDAQRDLLMREEGCHEVLVADVERRSQHGDAQGATELHRRVARRRTDPGIGCRQRPHDRLDGGCETEAHPDSDEHKRRHGVDIRAVDRGP